MARRPKAPEYLSAESRKWYQAVLRLYELEPHHVELLRLAALALDRAEQARQAIAIDGPFVKTRLGETKRHPAVAVERDSMEEFRRLTRELGLDLEGPDSRPPRIGG